MLGLFTYSLFGSELDMTLAGQKYLDGARYKVVMQVNSWECPTPSLNVMALTSTA